MASGAYGIVSGICGLAFFARACSTFCLREGDRGDMAARRLFHASLVYLSVLFLTLIIERIILFQRL